jgi:hypothetical protein
VVWSNAVHLPHLRSWLLLAFCGRRINADIKGGNVHAITAPSAAAASIAPALAKQGLDLLSGAFCGALNKGIQEIAKLIEGKTGIDINDVADNKLTESQWVKLKDFEFGGFKHEVQR